MLTKLLRWVVALLREREAYEELRRLDERMLRDIGLDRDRFGARF